VESGAMAGQRMVLPGDHPLWAPGAAHVFQQLGVGAAITDGTLWRAIYVEPNVTGFEREHSFAPLVDGDDLVSGMDQQHLNGGEYQRVVVDNENPRHGFRPPKVARFAFKYAAFLCFCP